MFPNSLITRTLDLTHESDIPIENPQVTPAVLELLEYILASEEYPYISDLSVKKALDYLGIDLPEFVYDPRYESLIMDHPQINVFGRDLDEQVVYNEFLRWATTYNFPPLAKYLIQHTDQRMHLLDNAQYVLSELNKPLHSDTAEDIMLMLLNYINLNPGGIQSMIELATVQGYVQFLQVLLAKVNAKQQLYEPDPNQIVDIITGLPRDLEHYPAYVAMIEYLGGYIPPAPETDGYEEEFGEMKDEDAEIRGFYEVFEDVVHGRFIESYEYLGDMYEGLLWAAVLSGQDTSFTNFLVNVPGQEYQQVHNFVVSYVHHPSLVNPVMLNQVGQALHERRYYVTINRAVNILEEKGHPELAQVLRPYIAGLQF